MKEAVVVIIAGMAAIGATLIIAAVVLISPDALECPKGEKLKVTQYQTVLVGKTPVLQPIYGCRP